MPYAMSVIISRAIPEIDGFKPSHRKLLYSMYKTGLLEGKLKKSASVVGDAMKLNPHGDASIYETMVRLTRGNEALLHPLVESKGNFAKQYSRDMAYAASRYTEVKLAKICEEIFKDINKNTVDFVDNYDGTMKEPTLLPVTFPNILVNPNQGIAVGMASCIPSFNLKEVCETTIAYLKNEKCNISDTLIAPDFSTGGDLVYDKEQLESIYETGRGSFKVRSKYRYDKKNSLVEIYEIPYSTTSEAIIDKIVELIKAGKIKEITDLRDETDLDGLKITLDVRKSANVEMLMQKLYKMTPLEDTFSCNLNILDKTTPKVMGIREVLKHWTDFRIECITRKTKFDLNKITHRLHLLEGLKQILLDIDKAIKIIRDTENDEMVIPNLMRGFDIDEIQADYIAEIKLRNLNKQYIINRLNDIEDLNKQIDELNELLGSEKLIKKLIISELKDIIKKYGIDRKTTIIYSDEIEEIKQDEMVEDYNLKIFLTKDGYLKKIAATSLRANPPQKVKDGDYIVLEQESTNKCDVVLISDMCNAYKLKLNDIPDCKASDWGHYVPNITEMLPGEKIVFAVATSDYKGNLIYFFENGKGAKVPLNAYETKTNRKKLNNAYSDKSKLIATKFITEDIDLVVYSSIEKILVFNTSHIPLKTTRNTQGITILNLKKKSTVTDVKLLSESNLSDPEYYRSKNIPATGYYLNNDDTPTKQMSLF
ncbi:MAG: topoisomerase IV [Ruminococcaceae bacterium]|nr:topoisomerase IV [Oscillospiraceae bacterium]